MAKQRERETADWIEQPMAETPLTSRPMPWITDEEMTIFSHVKKIRDNISREAGIMSPEKTTRALAIMSDYYRIITEKEAKAKAMRDEYFASLLRDTGLAIGKADGLAKGSEFGQKRSYYEGVASGYIEMIQALKKVMAFHENEAMNRF